MKRKKDIESVKTSTPAENTLVRQKHLRVYRNLDKMTPYEKARVIIAILHLVALLLSPLVAILITEYVRSRL